MLLSHLRILNYKGLREIDIPLSQFVCLIGENNAGKSSVLQAMALFFSGSALHKSHYFDPSHDVRIELTLTEISEADLNHLVPQHRERVTPLLKGGALTLTRIYGSDGKSVLRYRARVPRDDRFAEANVAELVKGQKPGKPFLATVVQQFPELEGIASEKMNQGEMKSAILKLEEALPDDQKIDADKELPTGLDKSIYPMLPEPLYIPAVKDLRDDVKTSESTPFGKILGILLKAIEPELSEEQTLFARLNEKLNRVAQADGTERDDRLVPIRTIEETVERFVQDSFRAVKLRITIPPPELKTVLSSAQIYANDGVDGHIETKGDGLRRAIVFAILRSFVQLSKTGLIHDDPAHTPTDPRYILLFEEPELYLHPKAQEILFEALGTFSQRHPVVVTTHSPAFFGPHKTTTFVKMRKKIIPTVAEKPFGTAIPIDLTNMSARDRFQLICYENNNIAFFADTVVLVEGDSDCIVLPHIARLLDSAWDCSQAPVRFARIGGKGSIRRYRQFFEHFGTRIVVVADLDLLLGTEFMLVDPTEEARTLRDQLLAATDAYVEKNGGFPEPTHGEVKERFKRGDLKVCFREAKGLVEAFKNGRSSAEDALAAFNGLIDWERYSGRKVALRTATDEKIVRTKRSLLECLRAVGVCVLERGAIEDYYPQSIDGDGKPAMAQCFCNTITSRDAALCLSDGEHTLRDGSSGSEFHAIFEIIFGA
jgi:energy-coupling factor transporter ATP-binding protein EcfA2